jgi:hypothetical protein
MEGQSETPQTFRPNPGLKLMGQVREVLRDYHYAYRTEQTYSQWILRDIHDFGGKTHPYRVGTKEVERCLAHPAAEGKALASTQRQALNALGFLYRNVLHKPLENTIAPVRSKCRPRPPTVLTQAEVQRLLYGGCLRLLKRIRLRSSRPFLRRGAPQEPVSHLPVCGDHVILDWFSSIFARYVRSAISGYQRRDCICLTRRAIHHPSSSMKGDRYSVSTTTPGTPSPPISW